MVTLLFPGQGSQECGMGKALFAASAAAREVFQAADDALSMSISRICFEGDERELRRTEITQPAILTVSVAAHRALLEQVRGLPVSFALGHSLGEWSALVAAGALAFEDAVRAVRERGRLMQAAVPEGQGAMAAVLGLPPESVREACVRVQGEMHGHVVVPANFNSPEQVVISGTREAVDATCRALTQMGAQKTIPLAVSAPFHSPLMEPAAKGLASALSSVEVSELAFPVVTNVEASPNRDASKVRDLLVAQVTAPVRWIESIEAVVGAGEDTAIELGPGKVLAGLARRIDRRLRVSSVSDPASLAKFVASLSTP